MAGGIVGFMDALEFPCTVCSAAIGQPCRDKQFREMPAPHQNRQWLARE